MQFVLIARDGKDENALERRMAVREKHLENAKRMFDEGSLLYASGLLDENGKMIGSVMTVDFPSKEVMEEEWLKREPYITGDVWKDIEIMKTAVAPFCLK